MVLAGCHSLLSKLGYQVVASTGRPDEAEYLTKLGAARIIDRAELSEKALLWFRKMGRRCRRCGQSHAGKCHRPNTLWGTVAACGLAQGPDLPATVMPFILRGIILRGIDSVMAPQLRQEAWARLAKI